MAADYDRSFTDTLLGGLMRRAVWRRMDAAFRPGDRVLELNCGTGADAVYLGRRGVRVLATDVSPAMVEVARAKVERAGLSGVVEVERLAIEELSAQAGDQETRRRAGKEHAADRPASLSPGLLVSDLPAHPLASSGPFDGALSNFGGLNCVDDLAPVAAGLAARLRPGASALVCLMGPLVPWEWGWFLRRGSPRKALRRLRRGGTPWRGMTIRYPSIGAARRAFAPHFRLTRAGGVGALLPPSYAEDWAARHPRLVERLAAWERRLEALPPLPWLADHYLLELERKA